MTPNADEEGNPLPNAPTSSIRINPSSREGMQPPTTIPLTGQGCLKCRTWSHRAHEFLVCSKCMCPPCQSPHRSTPDATLMPHMPGYILDPRSGDAHMGLKGRKRDIWACGSRYGLERPWDWRCRKDAQQVREPMLEGTGQEAPCPTAVTGP